MTTTEYTNTEYLLTDTRKSSTVSLMFAEFWAFSIHPRLSFYDISPYALNQVSR